MHLYVKNNFKEKYIIYDKYISVTQNLWKNEKSDFIQTFIIDKKEFGKRIYNKRFNIIT